MNNISARKNENNSGSPRVIVSLTTYPARIDRVNIAIESLLHQTRPADMVVLWLAKEQFPEGEQGLPSQLLEQTKRGLKIEWCEDIKSYKKLIPSAKKWPDDIIITADDDIIYRVDTIESLLRCYEQHPDCVSAVRTHLMLFDQHGNLLPYNDWKPEYSGIIDRPLMCLFPTTGAGTLFPPGILPEEFFNIEKAMQLCPKADDVWTKCMLTLANVPVVLAGINTRLLCPEGTQTESLYSYNLTENDTQIAAVLNEYNQVGGEENPGDTLLARMNDLQDHTPDDAFCQKYRTSKSYANEELGVGVSVIITAQNAERTIKRCLKSVTSQTISNIEIICVDMASSDATAQIISQLAQADPRIRLIAAQNCGETAARRMAVLDCKGEYCLFPDTDGLLAPDACQQLYQRAKEADTDILAFTSGVLCGNTEPENRFIGYAGRLRNTKILPRLADEGKICAEDIHSAIYGARLCRKAYIQTQGSIHGDGLFDAFLLARNAEVYVGEETPVYYAASEKISSARSVRQSFDAIENYIAFSGAEELNSIASQLRRSNSERSVERWYSMPAEQRADYLSELAGTVSPPELSAAIVKKIEIEGPVVLRALEEHPSFRPARNIINNVGVAVLEEHSAAGLFTMTEALDCIATRRNTLLLGVCKSNESLSVSSSKAVNAPDELAECDDTYEFTRKINDAMDEHALDALVLPADSPRFTDAALCARLKGAAVVALMTEQLCAPLLDCSDRTVGAAALRLADIIVTDSAQQQKLLSAAGLNARVIEPPAIRLMGGRSSGRASATAIVWAGKADEISEACKVFSIVRKSIPSAHMLLYIDGMDQLEELASNQPEGVSVRRLRPDYGIFADAAVHLMTRTAGTMPAALRAAQTLGVPTVMYRMPGEVQAGEGAVTVEQCDRASTASQLKRLLEDKTAREALGAQARQNPGGITREEAAVLWDKALESTITIPSIPVGELHDCLRAALSLCEDGAHNTAMRTEQFRLRCEQYEQQLAKAEERRVKETEALQKTIDDTKNRLREKEQEHRSAQRQLDEIRSSTMFKVGSVLTAIPRWIKKLLSGGK